MKFGKGPLELIRAAAAGAVERHFNMLAADRQHADLLALVELARGAAERHPIEDREDTKGAALSAIAAAAHESEILAALKTCGVQIDLHPAIQSLDR